MSIMFLTSSGCHPWNTKDRALPLLPLVGIHVGFLPANIQNSVCSNRVAPFVALIKSTPPRPSRSLGHTTRIVLRSNDLHALGREGGGYSSRSICLGILTANV